jgi:predicted nucleic acid-binding protein
MKVVIDTNILLIALPSRSRYYTIIQAFNRKVYQLMKLFTLFKNE